MREALTIRFYRANKFDTQFFFGNLNYCYHFKRQMIAFAKVFESKASREDIECVCGGNVITKAKLYNFSKN